MHQNPSSERGSAMVFALGVLTVLALLALIILSVVAANKRTESADYANNRSFYSADAASEAGVQWIHYQNSPPPLVDTAYVSVSTAYTQLAGDHQYKYNVRYVSKSFRPGWPPEFKDYRYVVEATGASTQQTKSGVEVMAARLFREGY